MKVPLFLLSFCLCMSSLAACTATTKTDTTNQDKADMTSVDSIATDPILVEPEISLPELNIDDFEMDYFKEIAKTAGDKSFTASPLSASFALAMIANISDSILQNRIVEALKFDSLPQLNKKILKNLNSLTKVTSETKTLIGNSLWFTNSYPIELGSRRDSLQKYFNATVEYVDFYNPQTTDIIAKWGYAATDGNIIPSVSDINNDCAIAVFNLIYYAGRWNMPFNESNTKKRSFHKVDCDTIVDMMYQELRTRYYHTNNYKAVTMNLGGDNSIILILPKKGLSPIDLIAKFDSSTIKRIINNPQFTNLKLSLPKFEIKDEQPLIQPLKKLGIELFPSQFKEIGLWTRTRLIDMSMNQLSKIKIDEQGVEASAETKYVTCILLAEKEEDKPQPVVVKFDRPFIFFLRNEKTKSLIMSGIYAGPEE